jgi:hypothetical protein
MLPKPTVAVQSFSFIESGNCSELVGCDSWKVVRRETFREFSFANEIVSFSATRKSVAADGTNPHLIQQVSWTAKTLVGECETLSTFRQDLTPEEFRTFCMELTNENWLEVSSEIVTNAVSLELESRFKREATYGAEVAGDKVRVDSITYDASAGVFTVEGEEREFWELPIPEAVITMPQLRELLARHLSSGQQRHVLEILVDLGARQIQDLVENIRLLYSVPFVHAPELVCGTEAMNQDPGGFIGWLLRPSRRKK